MDFEPRGCARAGDDRTIPGRWRGTDGNRTVVAFSFTLVLSFVP